MTDRLQAYQAFAELMDRRSFSAAAQVMGVPQSTVSKHIASLERALGVQLFVRTTRKLHPTTEAFDLVPHVQQMLDAANEIRSKSKNPTPKVSGKINIGSSPSYARHVLLFLIKKFIERHPDVRINITTGNDIENLVGTDTDLIVTYEHIMDGPYTQKVISKRRWLVVASEDYIARHGRPELPIDLEGLTLIIPPHLGINVLKFESEDGYQVVHVNSPINSNDVEFGAIAALNGDAIAVVPDWLLETNIYKKCLTPILGEHFLEPITMRIFYPSAQFLPRRTREIIDFLSSTSNSKRR